MLGRIGRCCLSSAFIRTDSSYSCDSWSVLFVVREPSFFGQYAGSMIAVIDPAHSLELSGSGPKAWIWSCFSSACSFVVVRQDDAAGRVNLHRQLEALLARVAEQRLEHGDDVLERVVVVVEQHDVVHRHLARLVFRANFGLAGKG